MIKMGISIISRIGNFNIVIPVNPFIKRSFLVLPYHDNNFV